MFKNLLVYRLSTAWVPDLTAVEAALDAAPFLPCGASQPVSAGWIGPRGQAHGALVESVGGHWLLKLMIEQKVLPGSVVKRRIDEMAQQIEHQTGRKPGKKQRKELKDQATLELLPQAFTKQMTMSVWIAPTQGLLMIDTVSSAKADEVITLLTKGISGFAVEPLHTALSPATAMADWLLGAPSEAPKMDPATGEITEARGADLPIVFSIDRECELKSADEMKSVVRYARHPLDTEEVRAHILLGKRPTRLALTWQGRVSFMLTDTLVIKKLDFLDGVYEGQPPASRDASEAFDADAAIATGELVRLIPDLIDALGGEQVPGIGAPSFEPVATGAPAAAARIATAAAEPTLSTTTTDEPPW